MRRNEIPWRSRFNCLHRGALLLTLRQFSSPPTKSACFNRLHRGALLLTQITVMVEGLSEGRVSFQAPSSRHTSSDVMQVISEQIVRNYRWNVSIAFIAAHFF
jgi:hypothetical protein